MPTWKEKALEIGKTLQEAARAYPELAPLCTSWMNFAHKRDLHKQADEADALRTILERHGLIIVPKQDLDRLRTTIAGQGEEIKALEHRISTLMRL